MEKVHLVPRLVKNWVMAVWVPIENDGQSGFYHPVGDPEKPLFIKDDLKPTRDDTILVMVAVTEHYSKSAVERTAEMREADDKKWATTRNVRDKNGRLVPDESRPMGDLQKQLYDMLKQRSPGLKDEYGRTTQFHGQTGVGSSPVEKKLVTLK